MIRKILALGIVILLFLSLLSCDDGFLPSGIETYGSFNADGTGFTRPDNRLMVSTWGRAFYVSDELIFHLSTKLYRRSMISNAVIQLVPDNLTITDTRNLAIDKLNQYLYFCANGDVYRVSFYARGLINLSADLEGSISTPRLSSCGNYLTAIRDGKVLRLDLNASQWLEISETSGVLDAVYIGDTDEYYLWVFNQQTGAPRTSLNRYTPAGDSLVFILEVDGPATTNPMLFDVSADYRFLGTKYIPHQSYNQNPQPLIIYDRINGTQTVIEQCFTYAFSKSGNKLIYSRRMHGLADIIMLDLDTDESALLFDGVYSVTAYSSNMYDFYWRHDDQRIFFRGMTSYRNRRK